MKDRENAALVVARLTLRSVPCSFICARRSPPSADIHICRSTPSISRGRAISAARKMSWCSVPEKVGLGVLCLHLPHADSAQPGTSTYGTNKAGRCCGTSGHTPNNRATSHASHGTTPWRTPLCSQRAHTTARCRSGLNLIWILSLRGAGTMAAVTTGAPARPRRLRRRLRRRWIWSGWTARWRRRRTPSGCASYRRRARFRWEGLVASKIHDSAEGWAQGSLVGAIVLHLSICIGIQDIMVFLLNL